MSRGPRSLVVAGAGYKMGHGKPGVMQLSAPARAVAVTAQREAARDWVAWYDELSEPERREIRGRLLSASYDEVKADAELRNYFFFHSEDVASDMPPGAERVAELHGILRHLRGAEAPDIAEQRRKAVAFLLAEYQRFLRDNPWD